MDGPATLLATPLQGAAQWSAAAAAWRERIVTGLQWLALRPAALVAVLWCLSAFAQPYANLLHDARLYALQVQNQISAGAFSGDLFLRFGSQDQYTPFSRLVAPLAALIGIEPMFLVLYLLFNGLLIYAIQRLVTALIDDPTVSTVALILMVLSPLPYGGLRIFHVWEPFFTPRTVSCALVALALERILRHKHRSGVVIAAAATIIHPLMGFAGVAIGIASAIIDMAPRRLVAPIIVTALGSAAALLAYRPLAVAVFGTIDAQWLDMIRRASAYNFPQLWTLDDWIHLSMSIALPVWAGFHMGEESPRRARFLFICSGLGAVGVAAMIVAGAAPYRLLLQAQPYRIVWVLQLLEIPLALWLAWRLWAKVLVRRLTSIFLIAYFVVPSLRGSDFGLSIIAGGVFLLIAQRPTSKTDPRDAIVPSLIAGFAVGCTIAGLIRIGVLIARVQEHLAIMDARAFGGLLIGAIGPVVWVPLVVWCIAAAVGRRVQRVTIITAAVVLAMATHTLAFTVPRSRTYRETQIPYGRDLQFVREYFARHHPAPAAPPTVYEGIWADIDFVWFELKAQSYFHLTQLSGVVFSRETALETRRRAAIVRPFELERYEVMRKHLPASDEVMITAVFQRKEATVVSTTADLRRLCRPEEHIDVAILKHDFASLAAASNGHVYIYECADVRAALTSD